MPQVRAKYINSKDFIIQRQTWFGFWRSMGNARSLEHLLKKEIRERLEEIEIRLVKLQKYTARNDAILKQLENDGTGVSKPSHMSWKELRLYRAVVGPFPDDWKAKLDPMWLKKFGINRGRPSQGPVKDRAGKVKEEAAAIPDRLTGRVPGATTGYTLTPESAADDADSNMTYRPPNKQQQQRRNKKGNKGNQQNPQQHAPIVIVDREGNYYEGPQEDQDDGDNQY